jgi:hypothetical protein
LTAFFSVAVAQLEPFHLFLYLDEWAFTFDERELSDWGLCNVLSAAAGRRLTYADVTGKTAS